MVGTALLLLGNGLLSTLIALRGSLEGYSDQVLGFMGSAYFVGFFLGTYVVPPLIRRMGHIRAFNFFAAGIAAIVLVHSLVVHPIVWIGLRLLTGIALVGFYTVIESWLNTQTVAERRGQIFAFYMVVNLLALAAAQQFLHFASPETFVLFSVAAIMVCLSVLPLASTRLPQPLVSTVPRLTIARLWRAAPAAVVAAVVSGLTMGTFWSMGPLYAARLGMDAGGVALLMTVTILGGGLMQLPLGRFSDRADRRYALATAAGGAAIAATAMAAVGASANLLLAACFFYGGMAFAIYPIAIAHLVDHLSHDDILSGNAGVLLLHGLGAVVGPTLAGLLMGLGGPAAMPIFFAAALGPLALYVGLQSRRTTDEIVEEPAQFVPMVRTAPTAMEIAAAVEEHRLEVVAETAAEAEAESQTEVATSAPLGGEGEREEPAFDSASGEAAKTRTSDRAENAGLEVPASTEVSRETLPKSEPETGDRASADIPADGDKRIDGPLPPADENVTIPTTPGTTRTDDPDTEGPAPYRNQDHRAPPA